MKKNKKIIILVPTLLALSIAGFFIGRMFINNNAIIDDMFFNEFNSNANNVPTNENTTLDDILGDDITDEDMFFLESANGMFEDSTLEEDTMAMLEIESTNGGVKYTNTIMQSTNVEIQSDSVVIDKTLDGQFEEVNMTPYIPSTPIEKPININSIILNYNDRLVTSRANPILVTIVLQAPDDALFTSIRVYARRLSRNNEILSRTPVFRLPKIYVVNGQAQTQFYFSGRTTANTFLPRGRYLLYVEAQVTDKRGNSIGNTGRYPLPQWKQVITIQ